MPDFDTFTHITTGTTPYYYIDPDRNPPAGDLAEGARVRSLRDAEGGHRQVELEGGLVCYVAEKNLRSKAEEPLYFVLGIDGPGPQGGSPWGDCHISTKHHLPYKNLHGPITIEACQDFICANCTRVDQRPSR